MLDILFHLYYFLNDRDEEHLSGCQGLGQEGVEEGRRMGATIKGYMRGLCADGTNSYLDCGSSYMTLHMG